MNSFDFKDVNLIPRKCIVDSRSECDTSIFFDLPDKICPRKFKLPVVPANMQCVIDETVAENLAKNGYFYIMHRFEVDNVKFIRSMQSKGLYSSISIGVNDDTYELLNVLRKEGLIPDYITIDIAHGHSIKMETMLKWIRGCEEFNQTFIIAGNVSTCDAVRDLEKWGANAIKIGIACGSACHTYQNTGFGSRGLQAFVLGGCSKATIKPDTKIIADGGIKEPGDIAKAIVLGADMVMIGGMFSGLKDSPGPTVEVNGKTYKEFWGSASAHQSGKKNRIEGVRNLIPLQDKNMLSQMIFLEESLQSSISYGGGKDLLDIRNVDLIIKRL